MEDKNQRASTPNVRQMNPFTCRMWTGHMRAPELITEDSCKEEIESFLRHGQKQPVLGRPVRGDSQYQVELIYGARRLFVAQHLNAPLLVDVRELSDHDSFIEMDIENRLRQDVSPYERGMAYKEWLRNGHFKSQKHIAEALGVSTAQISRLLRFAELPAVIVRCFGDLTSIRESWAIMLAERCKDPQVRLKITAVARSLAEGSANREPAETLRLLLDCEDGKRKARIGRTDTVVRSNHGEALFRVSYRHNEVHIVVPRDRARSETIEALSSVLKELIERRLETKPAKPKSQPARTYPFNSLPQHLGSHAGVTAFRR